MNKPLGLPRGSQSRAGIFVAVRSEQPTRVDTPLTECSPNLQGSPAMTDSNNSTDQNPSPDQDTSWKWSEEVTLSSGETLSADKLGRATYAEFLTNYLDSAGNRKGGSGYVMNLNAEWGAGKTWFLKRWCYELQNTHPVAYIDAWKNDFSDDPLITVIAGVLEALKKNPNVQWIEREQKLFEWLWKIAKGAAKPTDLYLKSQGMDGAGLLTALMDLHTEKGQGLEQSRKEISRWLVDVTEGPNRGNFKAPMYVFIDELDRCRPTYAIELLETVKHLFEIRGIVFVIATNMDQLQHSIKAVYGEGFDANRYLYRFFRRTYTLKQPDLQQFITTYDAYPTLNQNLSCTVNGKVKVTSEQLSKFLAGIAESSGFDLRTTGQWLDQLDAIYSNLDNANKYFWAAVALMVAMKLSDADLFYRHFHLKQRELQHPDHNEVLERSFINRIPKENRPERFLRMEVDTTSLPRTTNKQYMGTYEGIPLHTPDAINSRDSFNNKWLMNLRQEMSIKDEKIDGEHFQSFWETDRYPAGPECFWIALHYFSAESKARFQGYVDLVEQSTSLK